MGFCRLITSSYQPMTCLKQIQKRVMLTEEQEQKEQSYSLCLKEYVREYMRVYQTTSKKGKAENQKKDKRN